LFCSPIKQIFLQILEVTLYTQENGCSISGFKLIAKTESGSAGKDFMPKNEQLSEEKRQSLTFKDFHAPGEAYSSSKH